MSNILFLCQRIPYPPDKGDKIRSYRALQHLRGRGQIHLASFIDDPEDNQHLPHVEAMCASSLILPLNPITARLKSLPALLTGEPLSKRYFSNRRLQSWIDKTCNENDIDLVYVFSSVMAQYVMNAKEKPKRVVVDFVDVDSEKFRQYAAERGFTSKIVFGRESKTLLAFDREAGTEANACLFVSAAEAALFRTLAPELAEKTHDLSNGIDTEYFDPKADFPTKEAIRELGAGPNLIFTGRMDYRPNIDAVLWFAKDVFPRVLLEEPGAKFIIAGAAPAPEVEALNDHTSIEVTGRVQDMRPYLAYADVAVAPMFIGRGIQNKVLEAAAMARPIVTTPEGLEGIDLEDKTHLLVAKTAQDFLEKTLQCLDERGGKRKAEARGKAAREELIAHYAWSARMSLLDKFM
jgi:sugar transferase (PEP-CTERM/EpsH1 system associated)